MLLHRTPESVQWTFGVGKAQSAAVRALETRQCRKGGSERRAKTVGYADHVQRSGTCQSLLSCFYFLTCLPKFS